MNRLQYYFVAVSVSSAFVAVTLISESRPKHIFKSESDFILGMGRGTTGTHALNKATCRLGYPSVHWAAECGAFLRLEDEHPDNATSTIESHQKAEARNAHFRILGLFKMAAVCVSNQNRTRCGNALRWKSEMLQALHELVTSRAVYALHDSPYPSLLAKLMPMIRQIYGRDKLFLVLTERDPVEYVERRSSSLQGSDDFICRSEFVRPFDPATLSGGLLDWMACIEMADSAASASEGSENGLDLKQVLRSLTSQVEEVPQGRQLVIDAYKEWQDAARVLSNYHINLFEQQQQQPATNNSVGSTRERKPTEEIVDEIRVTHIPFRGSGDYNPRIASKRFIGKTEIRKYVEKFGDVWFALEEEEKDGGGGPNRTSILALRNVEAMLIDSGA